MGGGFFRVVMQKGREFAGVSPKLIQLKTSRMVHHEMSMSILFSR